jgi:uncharacterized protein (TIGR02453 family)
MTISRRRAGAEPTGRSAARASRADRSPRATKAETPRAGSQTGRATKAETPRGAETAAAGKQGAGAKTATAGLAKAAAVASSARKKAAPAPAAAKPARVRAFQAFDPALLAFLGELEENNNRDWFNANKHRYESDVLEPALQFIAAMAPRLESLSENFVALPQRIGGSLMRIHRDVRFGSDKRPYKTNVGIQFRHRAGKDVHAPGFYVHLEPGVVFVGAGLWRPDPEPLALIRNAIVAQPERWAKVCSETQFVADWELGGDSLKRPPRGYPDDHPHVEDLKRRDFIAARNLTAREIYKRGLPDRIAASFAGTRGFMAFLCDAVGVPF